MQKNDSLIDKLLINAFEEHQLELEFADIVRGMDTDALDALAAHMHDRSFSIMKRLGITSQAPSRDAIVAYVIERADWADANITEQMLLTRQSGYQDFDFFGLVDDE